MVKSLILFIVRLPPTKELKLHFYVTLFLLFKLLNNMNSRSCLKVFYIILVAILEYYYGYKQQC